MSRKFIPALALVGLMTLIPISAVFAQLDEQPTLYATDNEVLETTSEDGTEQTRQQRIAELKGLRAKARCTKVTANIAARLARYDANHTDVDSRFNGVLTKLGNASERLSKAGANVTELEAMIVDFGAKVSELKPLKTKMITQLSSLKAKVCSTDLTTKEEVKSIIAGVKQTLGEIRTTSKEARTMVKDTIVPEIKSLVAGLRANS